MKHCDLTSGVGRLHKAMAALREAWAEAKTHWNDSSSLEFDETYLRPIGPHMQMTVAAVQRLVEVLEEAERACDDPDARGG